jgi:dienelactone hydrolase
LRGGNDNPGTKEAFLGEVDDILAAALYLARQESVDSNGIFLGGHGTGGTLVLLVKVQPTSACLPPTNQLIARKNIGDEGPTSGLTLTETELNQPYAR